MRRRNLPCAFAQVQVELPRIQACQEVPDNEGGIRYRYAKLEHITPIADPVLHRNGFSYSYSTDVQGERFVTTLTLQHVAGHHRDYKSIVRVAAPPKCTASQADGSTMEYGRRYAMLNMLGLSIDHDTEGVPRDARNEGEPISDIQAQTLREMVKDTGSDEAKFLAWAGAKTFETIGSGRYKEVFAALQRKARS